MFCYNTTNRPPIILLIILLTILFHAKVTESSKILVFYHPVAKSHTMFMNYTAHALRNDGHDVRFMHTPLTEAASELIAGTEPDLHYWMFNDTASAATKTQLQHTIDQFVWDPKMDLTQVYTTIYSLADSLSAVCNLVQSQQLQEQLDQFKPDLMIVDGLFTVCVHNMPHKLNVPYIESVGVSFISIQANHQGCPFPPSYVTGSLLPLAKLNGFADRVLNTLDLALNFAAALILYAYSTISLNYAVTPFMFDTMMRNVSHYLVNDDPFLLPTRPSVPAVHLTGGGQLQQKASVEPLPLDLELFLQSYRHGTIIVSLSTMSKSSSMPAAYKRVFIDTFRRFPHYGIIWRYEGDVVEVANMTNVKVGPWFPFKTLLGDPRVVLLVTHGGINSVMEAAHFGVALVGIPLFGDQSNVLARAQHWTKTQIIWKHELTVHTLSNAIQNATTDQQLHNRVKRLQNYVADRITSPAHENKFWVEYALRHRGNIWHKPKAIQLSFWSYYYCDLLTLFVIIVVSVWCTLALSSRLLSE